MKRLLPFVLLLIIGLAGCKQKDVGPDVASKLVGNYEIWSITLVTSNGKFTVKPVNLTVTKKSNDGIHVQMAYLGVGGNQFSEEVDFMVKQEQPLNGNENIDIRESSSGGRSYGNSTSGDKGSFVKQWLYLYLDKDGYILNINAKTYL
jgi:hypothetical protein